MMRNVVAAVAVLVFGAALCGQDPDPVKEKLFAAKNAYDVEWKEISQQTKEWLAVREEAARKAGDLKALDELRSDRLGFDDEDAIPKSAPAAIRARQERALKSLESAYALAVKEYTRVKKDEHAAAAEAELRNIGGRLQGGDGIDLLALVNPKTHVVSGTWKASGRALVGASTKIQRARLLLPYEPSEEYDVEIKCRHVIGDDCLGVGLVSGGNQVVAMVDGWPMDGYVSGFDQVQGKNASINATTVSGARLKRNGAVNTVLCTVRTGQIDLFVNRKRVTSYKGESSQLQLYQEFRVSNDKALFVVLGPGSSYQIDAVKVTPVKGKGTVLK